MNLKQAFQKFYQKLVKVKNVIANNLRITLLVNWDNISFLPYIRENSRVHKLILIDQLYWLMNGFIILIL